MTAACVEFIMLSYEHTCTNTHASISYSDPLQQSFITGPEEKDMKNMFLAQQAALSSAVLVLKA